MKGNVSGKATLYGRRRGCFWRGRYRGGREASVGLRRVRGREGGVGGGVGGGTEARLLVYSRQGSRMVFGE